MLTAWFLQVNWAQVVFCPVMLTIFPIVSLCTKGLCASPLACTFCKKHGCKVRGEWKFKRLLQPSTSGAKWRQGFGIVPVLLWQSIDGGIQQGLACWQWLHYWLYWKSHGCCSYVSCEVTSCSYRLLIDPTALCTPLLMPPYHGTVVFSGNREDELNWKIHLFKANPNYVNVSNQLSWPSCLYSVDNCFEDTLSVWQSPQGLFHDGALWRKLPGSFSACWLLA